MDNRAIGLIDSGVGGFTVLKELENDLIDENFIYLGDSKNLPYGEKSNEEIIALVNKCIAFLESQNVKFIVLACNTASSLIKELSSNVPLFSIIDAGCQAVLDYQDSGKVGLIATRATVNNKAYDKIMPSHSEDIAFISYGTPTLAQVINNQIDEIVLLRKNIKNAIDPILDKYPINNLLLGCTHYPIVSELIKEIYPNLTLINPAKKEIEIIRDYLEENNLESANRKHQNRIFITGNTKDLKRSEKLLNELNINYELLENLELK